MHYVTGTLAVLLAVIVLVFAIQNLAPVDLRFLGWSMTLPKIILILATYILGMLTGWGLVDLAKRFWKSN